METDGRWVTINGAHIYIKNGQSPMDAFIKGSTNDMNNFISSSNDKLKGITNFEEFKNLENEINNSGHGLLFRTKKAKWWAYNFTDAGNGKINYLLSDGISRRTQDINKLYRYIEVSNKAR